MRRHFWDKLVDWGKPKESLHSATASDVSPPQWTPAAEPSNTHGRYQEATFEEYKEAEQFCVRHPVERPKLLPSDTVERLLQEGCRAWGMEFPSSPRFKGWVDPRINGEGAGVTRVITERKCKDVCIFSNLPIMAGLYDANGKRGIYYEVVIRKMRGTIAIGNPSSVFLRVHPR